MANPKRRNSRSRGGKRRAHDALTPTDSSLCTNCFERRASHQVCPHCGHYNGRQVIEVDELD